MVSIRPAKESELPFLREALAKKPEYEQVDLSKSIVFVAEKDGKIIEFLSARLIFQFEPMLVIDHEQPINTIRRACLGLAKAMEDFIRNSGNPVQSYFAHVTSELFIPCVEAWGLTRIYEGGKLYGRDL